MISIYQQISFYVGAIFSLASLAAGAIMLVVHGASGLPPILDLFIVFGIATLWAWTCQDSCASNRVLQVALLLFQAGLAMMLPVPWWPRLMLASANVIGTLALGFIYGFRSFSLYGIAVGAALFSALLDPIAARINSALVLVVLALFIGTLQGVHRLFEARMSAIEREKKSMSVMARLGFSMNSTLHDWEGRQAIAGNLLSLLESELTAVRAAEAPDEAGWGRVDGAMALLGKAYKEMAEWGREIRRRFIGGVQDDKLAPIPWVEFLGAFKQAYGFAFSLDFHIVGGPPFVLPGKWRLPLTVILDNLCRNAHEANATTIVVQWNRTAIEFQWRMTNDGIPLARCAACRDERCRPGTCGLFSLGKSTKPGGTGTGMLAVLSAVRRMGGTVALSSDDSGTSFAFSHPIIQ